MKRLIYLFAFLFFPIIINGQSISSDYLIKYSFEETPPIDSTGNYDATAQSFNVSSTQYHDGSYAGYFDGANDYVQLPAVSLPEQFSISLWCYVPSSTSNTRIFIANKDWAYSDDGFMVYTNEYLGTEQNVRFNTGNGSSGDNVATGNSMLAFGEWQHLTIMYNSSLSKGLIYINNVKKSLSDTSLALSFNRNATVRIGLSNDNFFDYIGYIDDLRIFEWWLSESQIDSLYNGYEDWSGEPELTSVTYRTGRGDVAFIRNGENKVPIQTSFSSDAFTGDVLYIDGLAGSDDSTGLTERAAIRTFSKAEELLDNTFEYVAIANCEYYESFNISSIIRDYGDPLVITTWHKYGDQNAVIKGLTKLTDWSQSGNYWTKSGISGLPPISSPNWFYSSYYFGSISCMNGLWINDTYYKISKYPNTKTYYDIESGDGSTYIRDTDEGVAQNDYWDGGILVSENSTWVNAHFPITNYTSNGTYYLSYVDWGSQDITDYSGMKYFIMNHHNAADQNGEWTQGASSLEVFYTTNLNSEDVYVPLVDSCLNISNSAYVTVKHIDFHGANKAQVRVNSTLGIIIDSCNFYRPPQGIAAYNNDTIECTHNNIYYPADNGIVAIFNDYSTYSNNYIVGAGVDGTFGGSRDVLHLNGIITTHDYGSVIIEKNKIDSTGYCGILVKDGSDDDVTVLIKNNWINEAMMVVSDGAAIYCSWNPYMTEKIIRGNLVTNTYNNTAFHRDGIVESRSIYLDEGYNDKNRNWLVDSNYMYGNCRGMFMNVEVRRAIWRSNIIANTKEYVSWDGEDLSYVRYGEYVDSSRYVKNYLVVGSEGGGHLAYMNNLNTFVSPTYEYENLIDSNNYYDPFDDSEEIWLTNSGYPDWTHVEHDLAWAQSTFSDWEDNSTFNKNSWTFGNVSGIDEDEFIWCFFNWSNAEYEFDLELTSFIDLDGNSVSGTMTLQPYTGKVLFYVSGSLSGLPDPIYY